jgi:hypothetical protein
MSDEFSIIDPHFDEDRRVYTAPLPDAELESLFSDIAAITVDENPGLLGRLQQSATPLRVLAGTGLGAVLCAVVVSILGMRGDLSGVSGRRMLAMLVVMTLMGVGSMLLSLRSLHQRTLESYAWLLAGLSLLLPVCLSLIPGLWPGVTSPEHLMPWESGCFWFGTVVASLTGAGVLLLQRSRALAGWRVLSAAAAGGFAGFVTQQLFCPANDTWHLLTTHGMLGLVVCALLLTVVRRRMRRADGG